MKTKRFFSIATFLMITVLFGSFQNQKDYKVLFEKAKYTMETKADLKAAINLFESLIKTYPNEKEYVAKSLLYQGMCYEKLGNQEAVKKYQRLVQNFPGQKDEVAYAKERLSKLVIAEKEFNTPLTPKFTKIKIPTNPGNGVLAPDGNKLAFVSDGAVWIIPIHGKVNPEIAGEPFRIAEMPDAWDYGSLTSWSEDGKWIAVNGKETDKGTEVYVIKVSGEESHVIQIPFRGGHSFSYRLSLSPDGQMLAFSAIEIGTEQEVQDPHDRRIYTIPVKGAEPKQVSSDGARATLPSFSPDGRFIAYVGYGKRNIGELWIVPSSGGDPIKLAEVDGRLRGPIWSSDCKYIAAHYEPGGTNSSNEILVYPLSSDLSTAGKPAKITLPGESFNLLAGWTPENELGVFIQSMQRSAIYTVPATGGKAVQVTPEGLWPYYPRWSPDGKRIYFRPPFISEKGDETENNQSPMMYVSATGGNPVGIPVASDQDLTTRVPGGGFNISPDGKKIVISTGRRQSNQNESNLWTISIVDGQPTRLTSDRYFDCRFPCWSPDGKWIAFIDDTDTQDKKSNESFTAIYIIPAEGGKIRQITTEADKVGEGAITFSTNGEQITFFSEGTIKSIPVEGGLSKVLVENINHGDHSQISYSPDGSKIAHNARGKIWITSLDKKETKELSTGLPKSARLSEFAWSPDSKKFAFFCSSGGEPEFWLVSNFLPLDKLAQKNEIAEETPKVMTSKKIWEEDEIDNLGEISPDGKYISYTDWPAGDLAIYEIATGKKRRLTSYNFGETWSTGSKTTFVLSSIWSANSRQIIYSTGTGEIRTIGLENSTPRTIRKKEAKNEFAVQVLDISGDGKTILGTIETMDTTTQIVLFSMRDGEKQIIKELPGFRILRKLKFTSDGAGVVYDYPPDLDSPVHDIYWLSLDGKTETPIIKHPAHDFVLDLSPDGKQLLFASSRSGKMGFYYVGLKNGKTLGNPKFIKTSEYPNLTGLGFSNNGVFYSFYQPFVTDVYETEINSETGAIVSHPNEIIGSFMGENSTPDYSSDGKYLAFISRRPPFFTSENGPPTGNALCIKSLENGTLREIKPDIENFENPKWSPDNRSILMMNWNNKERMREIYKIDLQSEKLSLIFSDKSKKIFDFEWCADGMSILMVLHYQENDTAKTKLVRYNLETKEEKILYVNHGRKGYFTDLASISCSPDGKWIAFLGLDQKKTIKIIPTSGGEVREIYSLDQKKTIDGKQIWSSKSYANLKIHHCWSADGKYIYLQKFREPRGDDIWNLWQVPVNGGNPVNLGLEMTRIWQINAHPDGRKLVYSNQGSSYKLPQVWMMENFLPKE